jgi:hypothetical protein
MPKLNPIPKDPKVTSDKYYKAVLKDASKTTSNVQRDRKSNGRVGAAVAGRKLTGGAKTRGGTP